jgi:hypothetical protein
MKPTFSQIEKRVGLLENAAAPKSVEPVEIRVVYKGAPAPDSYRETVNPPQNGAPEIRVYWPVAN